MYSKAGHYTNQITTQDWYATYSSNRKINTEAQLTNPTCIYGLYVSVSTDFFLTARVKKVALFLESVKAYCVVVAGLDRNRSRL